MKGDSSYQVAGRFFWSLGTGILKRELDQLIRVIYTRPKVTVYYSMNSVNIFDQRKELNSKIISNPEAILIKEGEFVKGVGEI